MKLKFENEFLMNYSIICLLYLFTLYFFPQYVTGIDPTTAVIDNFAIALVMTIASRNNFLKAYCIVTILSFASIYFYTTYINYWIHLNFLIILAVILTLSLLLHVAYESIKNKKNKNNVFVHHK